MGKSGRSYKGRPDIMLAIRKFIDEQGKLVQLGEIRNHFDPKLELQIGDHAGQIAVPRTFSVAVNCALNLGSSYTQGR
jgi:hypothetical protein